MFRPVRLLSPSIDRALVRRATIQMLCGSALYAGTTIAAYWFPVIAFLVIFASQAIWIILSVTDDQ